MIIRKAEERDLEAINDIYNESVKNSTATFDTEPKSIEERKKWFYDHDELHPIIVAEMMGNVVGWASMNKYSDRLAYAKTAENSLYVYEKFRGLGIGKKLLIESMEYGRKAGLHTVLSRITEENQKSIIMHEKAGFFTVGIMKEVGVKFDRLLDVRLMQIVFKN